MVTFFATIGVVSAKLWVYVCMVATHWLPRGYCFSTLVGLATLYKWLVYWLAYWFLCRPSSFSLNKE
jgi:hypothetical protein